MAAEQDQRRFGLLRDVKRRQSIGMSRSGGQQRHAGLLRQPAPGIGHMHRRRFMPHMNQIGAGVQTGVEDGQALIA